MGIAAKMKASIQIRSDIPAFLLHHALSSNVAEIGVRYGYHFQQLLAMKPVLAVGIDHYRNTEVDSEQDTNLTQKELDKIHGDVVASFIHNPAVKIIREKSEVIVNHFPLQFFDYVYLDADHSYEAVLKDMRLWWSHVRQGGIMAGHDYIEKESKNGVSFGVIQAVAEFMEETGIPEEYFHHTEKGYCSWMLFKEDGE